MNYIITAIIMAFGIFALTYTAKYPTILNRHTAERLFGFIFIVLAFAIGVVYGSYENENKKPIDNTMPFLRGCTEDGGLGKFVVVDGKAAVACIKNK